MIWIEALARIHQIPFINLTRTFKAFRATSSEPLYSHDISGHFTPLGHRLTAATLDRYTRDHWPPCQDQPPTPDGPS
ncbi:MAG: SGNH/GDSL hydrolase family protein [Magnetococcales bacterium]|nr:SGNH/GDSL hydrolase family protein [Magnetococcales bacterium]